MQVLVIGRDLEDALRCGGGGGEGDALRRSRY